MNYGFIFMLIVAALYLAAAFCYVVAGRPLMALVVTCYAISNAALAMIGK